MTVPTLSPRVAALLEKTRRSRGRLIFALDATASRERTWDMAAQLQAAMFEEAAKIGGLDVQLVYYRDTDEVRASAWFADAHELVSRMSAIKCMAGTTKIARVLRHIRSENEREKVSAAVFVGDAVEEPPQQLYDAAAGLGVPLFCFQEGDGLALYVDQHGEFIHEHPPQTVEQILGLRAFGLKCVGITPREQEKAMVDARKYASKYVKPDNVRDGPLTTRILSVFEGTYGLVLELETGSQFSLNEGNTNVLIKTWGYETDKWVGDEKEIELFLGTYRDWNEDPPKEKETVKLRVVSPGEATAANGGAPAASKPPLPPTRTAAAKQDDMDDTIPFTLAFLIISAVAWLVAGSGTLIA